MNEMNYDLDGHGAIDNAENCYSLREQQLLLRKADRAICLSKPRPLYVVIKGKSSTALFEIVSRRHVKKCGM